MELSEFVAALEYVQSMQGPGKVSVDGITWRGVFSLDLSDADGKKQRWDLKNVERTK